jgi:hypothetical protein
MGGKHAAVDVVLVAGVRAAPAGAASIITPATRCRPIPIANEEDFSLLVAHAPLSRLARFLAGSKSAGTHMRPRTKQEGCLCRGEVFGVERARNSALFARLCLKHTRLSLPPVSMAQLAHLSL